MDYRLPYYMAYPMPLQYDDERIERYDFEYMKSMYPQTAKKVLPYVEDECDRMEYEGSMMSGVPKTKASAAPFDVQAGIRQNDAGRKRGTGDGR